MKAFALCALGCPQVNDTSAYFWRVLGTHCGAPASTRQYQSWFLLPFNAGIRYKFGSKAAVACGAGQGICVKPGTDTPDASQVVQTTTTRRVIPVSVDNSRKSPEFWEYLESLSPPDWGKHILYIYRVEPSGPGGQSVALGKFVDTAAIPWHDREEAELAIAQKYGGRMFRVIVKRGSERVTEGKIYIDAAPRMVAPPPEASGSAPTVFPVNNGEGYATADVAKSAFNTIANQDRQAVEIGISALAQAANVIKNFAAQPAPGPADDLTKQFMAVMIQRMLQPPPPPPDPLELLTKLLALQAQLGQGANPLAGITDKFLTVASERMFNPQPSGPATSAGAELVRQLPTVATAVSEGIREWRMGMEAQRDAIQLSRGALPPQPALVQPPALPQPNPQLASGASAMPGVEFIEGKIVEILKEPISADEAAEKTVDFLDVMDASLVDQLSSLGEPGLLNLFNTRPILRAVVPAAPQDTRLKDFVRAFLKYSSESGAAATADGKPN